MKILLFTSSRLTDSDSGWLLLNKMLSRITEHEIILFSVNHLLKAPKRIQNCEVIHYPLFLDSPKIKTFINKKWEKLNLHIALFYSKILARKIRKIVRGESIDKLWVHSFPLSTLTLARLIEKPFIPYHVSVFDDLFYNRNQRKFLEITKDKYVEMLKASTSLDVVVPEQKDFYIEKKIIKPGHPVGISYAGYFKKSTDTEFEIRPQVKRICITGNIFWLESFLIFCSAIEKVCLEQDIEIHVFSNGNPVFLLGVKKRLQKYSGFVSFRPFIPEKEIIHTIAKYDLAFLQMSFHQADKHKCITSFPSKTHNYLSSTVPILLYSPDYASVSKFLNKNHLCHTINTTQPDKIKIAFNKILNSKVRDLIHQNIIEFNARPNINSHFDDLTKIIGA